MTTPISAEQWQQLRTAGYTDAVIMQTYHYDPTPAAPVAPPPLPGPALPAPAAAPSHAPIDLSDGKFGAAEGRHPEDGRHSFEIVNFDRYKSPKDGMDFVIVEYLITASSNPQNEIGGKYSKSYRTRPGTNDFGKSRDALKGLLADIAKHVTPGCRPDGMASTEWNATVNAIICGKGVGVKGTLSTRTTRTGNDKDFTHHDWLIGKLDDVNAAKAPPALTLPPMPAPSTPVVPHLPPPGLPPMPGAPPAPPMPGAAPKPPGWQGAWPPGSAA